MKELLRNALRLADVDYCEIRFEQSEFLSIGYQGKELDRIVGDTPYGGNVRSFIQGWMGVVASFNSLDDLDEAVKSACRAGSNNWRQTRGRKQIGSCACHRRRVRA